MKLLYLGNKLSRHGFNKTTVETLGLQLAQEGFAVYSASDKKSFPLRMLDMIRSVFLYRNQVSYILIDTYSTKAFWYAFVCSQLARIFKIPYIPILHGGDLPTRLQKNPILCKMVFAHAYQNVAPSGFLHHFFLQAGYSNIVSIPNTLPLADYTFTPRTEFAPKLLWVRAFASIYNPSMAVEVLAKVQKLYPNASMTMVGPDKDGSMLVTKALAQSLGVSVVFTGQLTKEAWWELSKSHAIFINTTHFDNTPVSVMEAMALGLPVVSTDVGGIPYLLTSNENALLVADCDVHGMVQAIAQLVSDPAEGQRLAANARAFVAKMDWDLVKMQWISLLH